MKEIAKERWKKLLQSLILDNANKRKKKATGKIVKDIAVEKNSKGSAQKLKKNKTISVTECSSSKKGKKR